MIMAFGNILKNGKILTYVARNQEKFERASSIFLVILMATLVFKLSFFENLPSYGVIAWLASQLPLVYLDVFGQKKAHFEWESVLILSSYFLLIILGLLFTSDISRGLSVMERGLTLLAFPLFLGISSSRMRTKYRYTLRFFPIIVSLSLLIAIFLTVKQNWEWNQFKEIIGSFYFYHSLSWKLGMLAIHLALYTAFSLGVVIAFMMERDRSSDYGISIRVVLAFCLIVFLGIGLVFLSARMVFVAFFIALSVSAIALGSNRLRTIVLTGIGIVLIAFLVIQSRDSFFKDRYINMLKNYEVPFEKDSLNAYNTWNSLNMRKATWSTAIELIKENPGFGVGTGDDEAARVSEYKRNGFHFGRIQNFNEHNQYLGILVRFGVFGLLVFLIPFIWGLLRAIKHRDTLYFFFLLLFMFSMLTENFFESDRGVIFFALMNSILFFSKPLK